MSEDIRKKENIRCIRCSDEDYPGRLRRYNGMPKTLYALGDLPCDGPSVAIVGARRCSHYGRRMAELFGQAMAENNIVVISGMAEGIDGCAQRAALAVGGKSYGVLGSGVDICYPAKNRDLYEMLIRRGGLISEQETGSPPLSCYFPARNRIISAMADVVLVVEARARSGSLITVDFALEQGKCVYAVPGRVGDALSDGCNELIAQGAGIATSPQVVIDEARRLYRCCSSTVAAAAENSYRTEQVKNDSKLSILYEETHTTDIIQQTKELSVPLGQLSVTDMMQEAVYRMVGDDPISLGTIAAETGITVSEAAGIMAELVLDGRITELGYQQYVRLI